MPLHLWCGLGELYSTPSSEVHQPVNDQDRAERNGEHGESRRESRSAWHPYSPDKCEDHSDEKRDTGQHDQSGTCC